MAKSMSGQLSMFNQTTCEDSSSATSSPASEAGPTPCGSPDGLTTEPSGPGAVLVSRSVSRAMVAAPMIRATFGLPGASSYASADLQRRLVSRLKRQLPSAGGIEFVMTWRTRLTPARRSVSRLQASALPMSESACFGWPTPVANDDNKTPAAHLAMKARMGGNRTAITSLQVLVKAIALGWPTPTAVTDSGGAALCKWGGTRSRQKLREAVGDTVLNGALNPAFPCWLMGYEDGWLNCAASAMPSSRKSRRSSSRRTKKHEPPTR